MYTKEAPLVLVVDDDPSVRRSLERLLRSASLDVQSFASAREFFEFKPRAQALCVLLDLHLPDSFGFDLLRRIKKNAPKLPLLVITGEQEPGLREQALREGAAAFLAKPFDGMECLDEVRRAVALSASPDQLRALCWEGYHPNREQQARRVGGVARA